MMRRPSARGTMLEWESRGGRDLNVCIRIPPEEWHPRQPVFGSNRAPHPRSIFDRQNACRRGKFRPGDFSANRAGSNLDLRVIANTLHLAEFAVRHEAEFVAFFSEPDGGGNGNAGLAEGGKRDVFLSMDRSGDGHRHIVINADGRELFGNNSGRECGRLPEDPCAVIQ